MSTRLLTPLLFALLGTACGEPDKDDTSPPDDSSGPDCSDEDVDGDGLDGCAEEALGTDPATADSDGDGLSDGEEADCVSDPLDAAELCYACGWPHNDPGDLASTGTALGDVVANVPFIDQCGELVDLWDFAREYHILFITASW
jgi:hypothetical protein